MIAVTALSKLPHHLQRQTICLDSWVKHGCDVVAVVTGADRELFAEQYPQVGRWEVCDELSLAYQQPTQRINRLANVAASLGEPVLLINSDIEIDGDMSLLTERIHAKSLVAGIRHNHAMNQKDLARQERWGLDAFYLTPEMVRTLPQMQFAIGKPVWDYWLPLHFRQEFGFTMDFVGEPLFFHEMHAVHWSQAEWNMGADELRKRYGYDMPRGASRFRRSLPFWRTEVAHV